jgi:hypothetical protein
MINWEKFWKKRQWSNLKYYPGIYLEGLRKMTEILSQQSRSSGRDLNSGPPEYDVRVLYEHDVRFVP